MGPGGAVRPIDCSDFLQRIAETLRGLNYLPPSLRNFRENVKRYFQENSILISTQKERVSFH
jgi:hypothetical protein